MITTEPEELKPLFKNLLGDNLSVIGDFLDGHRTGFKSIEEGSEKLRLASAALDRVSFLLGLHLGGIFVARAKVQRILLDAPHGARFSAKLRAELAQVLELLTENANAAVDGVAPSSPAPPG